MKNRIKTLSEMRKATAPKRDAELASIDEFIEKNRRVMRAVNPNRESVRIMKR